MVLSRACLLAVLMCAALPARAGAAGPSAATTAAFSRYVAATEARIDSEVNDDRRFLRLDVQDTATRQAWLGRLRGGQVVVERMQSRDNGQRIDVPDAMVHHWIGTAFIPGGTARAAVDLLRDYDHHAEIYAPAVQRSKVLSRSGNALKVHLRFFMKRIVSVTLNTDHDAEFFVQSPLRAHSRIRSTRVQEVEDAGTRSEREMPIGQNNGYLWRINSYWRFLERDGGVYIQCESISLTRDIPTGLGWIVGPFVTSVPRESLEFTMDTTRRALAAATSQRGPSPKSPKVGR